MSSTRRWTSADLEEMPDDGKRYEVIAGELYVSDPPNTNHQDVCTKVCFELDLWNRIENRGHVLIAPGLIFADDDEVAPDLVWISNEQLETALGEDSKLHSAPELVVEVLSSGSADEKLDREIKLELYSRRGVSEYWILSWQKRQIDLYRREEAQLKLAATLFEADMLDSPLLPGFSPPVASLLP